MAGFIKSVEDEVAAPWGAGSFDVFHDGCAADLELGCQVSDSGAGAVAVEELVHFFGCQAVLGLFVGERSGSSTGWAISALTSENLTNTGQDVGVGVTAQELHFPKPQVMDLARVEGRNPRRAPVCNWSARMSRSVVQGLWLRPRRRLGAVIRRRRWLLGSTSGRAVV